MFKSVGLKQQRRRQMLHLGKPQPGGFIQAEKNENWVSKPLPPWGRGMEVREKAWTLSREMQDLCIFLFSYETTLPLGETPEAFYETLLLLGLKIYSRSQMIYGRGWKKVPYCNPGKMEFNSMKTTAKITTPNVATTGSIVRYFNK